jgi:EPS-associated MarR family transcriptional regulator
MNKFNSNNSQNLEILRKINKKENLTQRGLANDLGFSLGKLNFLLNELKKKGLLKINNFKKNPSKLKYLLTPKGISLRTRLTINFMKRKITEYDELKKELDEQNK